MGRPGGIRRTVRTELLRQGLQSRPKQIIAALAARGIRVDATTVLRVRFELLRERSRVSVLAALRKNSDRHPPRRPQKRPSGR